MRMCMHPVSILIIKVASSARKVNSGLEFSKIPSSVLTYIVSHQVADFKSKFRQFRIYSCQLENSKRLVQFWCQKEAQGP